MLFLFHLSERLCSNVAAELCGAPSRWGQESLRLPPAPVGTHPNGRRIPVLAVHSRCSSPINFAPIKLLSFGPLLFCCHFFLGHSKNCMLPPALHTARSSQQLFRLGTISLEVDRYVFRNRLVFLLRLSAMVKKVFSQGVLS